MELEEIKKLFTALRIPDWDASGNMKSGGQSTTLEVRNSRTSAKGVFRILKRTNETDVKRFKREVKILSDSKFKNKNIVNILAYSMDGSYWYISEKGDSFEAYWDTILAKHKSEPDTIVRYAVDIVLKILNGLAPLHNERVVHRDIKPPNLVMSGDEPVLIDFGLAFDEEDERITPIDHAVGNTRYSPDQMMNRMEDVPPWLDVFQITQLLIWMVSVKPNKAWTRPLDWRWVKYDNLLSTDSLLALRGLTAICSDPIISPKNALELKDLINNLFKTNIPVAMPSNIREIIDRIRLGTATSLVAHSEDVAAFNNLFPLFYTVYSKVVKALKEKSDELKIGGLPIVAGFASTDSWVSGMSQKDKFTNNEVLQSISITCGTGNKNFCIAGAIIFYVPSLREIKTTDYHPEGFLPLAFEIGTTGTDVYVKKKTANYYVAMNREGKIFYSRFAGEFKSSYKSISIDNLSRQIVDLMEDPESWELIHS